LIESEYAELCSSYTELFEDWEIAIARKLIGEYRRVCPCLEREELADLMQECLTHWVLVRDWYDAARGASQRTFMARVVRNLLRDMVRSRRAYRRRASYVAISLDEPLGSDESSSTLADELDEAAGLCERRDATSRIELRLDLEKAVKSLTPRQRKICHHLCDGYSFTELSRILRTPRTTVHDEVRRIESHFKKRGLEDYLR
jgi:RNA polymerase sigma-70 factor (ECF subfamily)